MYRTLVLGLTCFGLLMLAALPVQAGDPPTTRDEGSTSIEIETIDGVAELQAALRSSDREGFGGLWLDASGVVHVALTGSEPGLRGLANGQSMTPTFHTVQFSEHYLDSVMADIADAINDDPVLASFDFSWIAPSLPQNAIVVHFHSGTQKQLDAIADRFGPAIMFAETSVSFRLAACTRTNCPNPLKAGLQLYKHQNWTACMSAFMFRDEVFLGEYYIGSAGHCFDSTWVLRYHPANVQIGNSQGEFHSVATPVDAMLINIPQNYASNKLFVSSSLIRSVTSIETLSNEVIGESVCSSRLSGVSCGALLNKNVCIVGGACGQRLASNQYACSGDSGSPVYAVTGSTTARAIGIITASTPGSSSCPNGPSVASNSLYTHIAKVENYSGASVITN